MTDENTQFPGGVKALEDLVIKAHELIQRLQAERDDYRVVIETLVRRNQTRGYPTPKEWIELVNTAREVLKRWEGK